MNERRATLSCEGPSGTLPGVRRQCRQRHYGGEVAEVWVDGGYAGRADAFDPQSQPLTLTVGVHHLERRAPGYVTLAIDVAGRSQPGSHLEHV